MMLRMEMYLAACMSRALAWADTCQPEQEAEREGGSQALTRGRCRCWWQWLRVQAFAHLFVCMSMCALRLGPPGGC